MSETLADELLRLVEEYHGGRPIAAGGVQEEAWNLIADFAVEHAYEIAAALRDLPTPTSHAGETE